MDIINGFLKMFSKEEEKPLNLELEEKLKQKNLSEGLSKLIVIIAMHSNQDVRLSKYLDDPKLTLDDLKAHNNLIELIKQTGFNESFINNIIGIVPSEGGNGIGKSEIALILFFKNAAKSKKHKNENKSGDIDIDGNIIEIKSSYARFPGKGIGRGGNIQKLFSYLDKTYDIPRVPHLSEYIKNIYNLTQDKELFLKDINFKLNNIYPNSDINVTPDNLSNLKNILILKYISSYVNAKQSDYYLLVSSNTNNYNIYSGDELKVKAVNGDINFTAITPSSSYPQLKL
jgi:hypothetical protein